MEEVRGDIKNFYENFKILILILFIEVSETMQEVRGDIKIFYENFKILILILFIEVSESEPNFMAINSSIIRTRSFPLSVSHVNA